MRHLVAAMALVALTSAAHGATQAEWRVNLVKGSSTQATLTGSSQEEAWSNCQLAIPTSTPVGTYTCQTPRFVAVVTADPPPAPIDCAVSPWTDWTGGAWSSCTNGMQSRQETRVRTVLTAPANGGQACPALSETRTATATCVPPPPVDQDGDGVPDASDECPRDAGPAPSGCPIVTPTGGLALFTDLLKGPAGAPLTICGRSISTVTIGGIITPIVARKSANPANDCVRVTPASSGAIAVNGNVSALTYTVSAGSVLYVSLTGNDATAAKNDPTKPWRHVQGSTEKSGALGAAAAGDVIVVRGGEWTDLGYNSKWFRLMSFGNVAVVSYPGEDVHWSGGKGGGIHGPDSGHAGKAPNVTLSGLRIDSPASAASDGAPVNLQYGAAGWRVVNCDLSWPGAASGSKAAAIAGNGDGIALLGNALHDIGGGQENHGIYIDGDATGVDIGWNLITRITSGNLLQTYGGTTKGVRVHDNDMGPGGRYGLMLGDSTTTYEAWGNRIFDTGLAAVRLNFNSSTSTVVSIHDNVLTNVNTKGSPSSAGAINCDSQIKSGTVTLTANKITRGAGAKTDFSIYGSCPAVKFTP